MPTLRGLFECQRLSIAATHLGDARLGFDFDLLNYSAGRLTAVVGDMADTHTGTSYKDLRTAEILGLPNETLLNAAHIGKAALIRTLPGCTDIGPKFIRSANAILQTENTRIGLLKPGSPPDSADAAERCAGVLTQVVIDPITTRITSMSDMTVWVNGEPVWKWGEFPLAGVVNRLMTALVEPTQWERAIRRFEADTQNTVACLRLREALEKQRPAAEREGGLTQQQAHMAVSLHLMAEYVRVYQNHPTDPLGYGVVDGTATPTKFIGYKEVSTDDIESIIIATDGLQPAPDKDTVCQLADLGAANPQFSDQTAIEITRLPVPAKQHYLRV